MMPMTFLLLSGSVAVTALAISTTVTLSRSRKLHAAATKLGMQFSHADRFDLAPRVAFHLPSPGASAVNVRDVAYASTDAGLLCVMTAAYTLGTVGRRRHLRQVCAALDLGGKHIDRFKLFEGPVSDLTYTQAAEHLRAAPSSTPPPPAP